VTRRPVALAAAVALALGGCGAAPPSTQRPVGDAMGQLGPIPSATPGSRCLTPAERDAVVHFRSGNGALLAGALLGTGRAGVVLAHSNNTDMCDWVPYGRVLAAAGYAVLSLDLNGYGASQTSPGVPVDPRYDADLTAAVAFLRGRGVAAVFLMGEVIGGTAAVKAATETTPPVAGVIAVSSIADTLRMDAVAAARRLAVPILCIASGNDEFLDGTRQIAAASTGAPYHDLLVVPEATGGETSLFDPAVEPAATRVRARVAAFLARYSGTG
jgi:alpha-beta hydrolase superfamily lysophospholipase